MKLSEIRAIATKQKEQVAHYDIGLPREILPSLPNIQTHALIVSGIRRCGKSTLLLQFVQSLAKPWFYLNFEDIRLSPFAREDFALLDRVIEESGCRLLFFDEIQAAENWELYIRQKLDQHFQVLITGSNASLLSSELGTKLTGRHISKLLFPFSYAEFLAFFGLSRNLDSLDRYLELGGFPEYLKTSNPEILMQLQSDILYRDIAVRYGIRDVSSLKRLFTILVSSAG
ncbi:MAG TPA: ATP-binding protein, partial [Rectinema sp.]|nr:ATP-binding protein [Rectinema sp.]